LDYEVLGKIASTGNLDVLLVAVKREKITDHTSVISMAGKNPVIVDVDAFASRTPTKSIMIPRCDDGRVCSTWASIMTINIVSGRDFLFTRDVGVGGHSTPIFLQKEFNLNFSPGSALNTGMRRRGRTLARRAASSIPSAKLSASRFRRLLTSSNLRQQWTTSTACWSAAARPTRPA